MKNKQNFSKQKYEEQIVFEINSALRKSFKDPRLQLASVTHVELSSDYSSAKVYWDTFDLKKKGEVKDAFKSINSKMRKHLASVLDVRHTPALEFIYNSQYEDEQRITDLLNSDE